MLQSKVRGRYYSSVCVQEHTCIRAGFLSICLDGECVSAFACMHPSVCASFIIHAMFSLLSVFVFTCSSYLKWPRRRSNPQRASHLSLSEGQIVSPSLSRPAPTDTGKAGKETFVKRFPTACKDGAETSPALSAYTGRSSGLGSRLGSGCDGYKRPFCSFIRTFHLHPEIAIDFF